MEIDYYGSNHRSTELHVFGKGKVPVRSGSESAQIKYSAHLAKSQVAQELPAGDYAYWEKSLFFPETSTERLARLVKQVIRRSGPSDDPNTLAYTRQWALRRFIFRAGILENASQTLSRAAFERDFGLGTSAAG